jgi:MFS family permease
VLSATSAGQVLMPLVWAPLLEAGYNWRYIAGALSLGSLLISTPLWLFFMSRNGATQNVINQATSRSANEITMWQHFKAISKERGFWLIVISVFLVSAVDQAMTQNHVTYLRVDKGINLNVLGWASSFAGVLAFVSKPLCGSLYDRYSLNAIKFFYFLLGVSVLLALPVSGTWTLLIFLAVLGFAHGALIVEVPVLTKHYLGTKNMGMTIGLVSVAVNLGFAAGPPLLGQFVDHYGNFTNGLLFYAFISFVGFFLLLPIKPRFWVPPSQRKNKEQEAGVTSLRPASA